MKTDTVEIKVQLNEGARLPVYGSSQAAGADLCACLGIGLTMTIEPHKWAMVPTGVRISLPAGYEAQVRPRSGLAAKSGISVLNSPGTVDSDQPFGCSVCRQGRRQDRPDGHCKT